MNLRPLTRHLGKLATAVKDKAGEIFDIRDAHTYGGIVMLGYGLYQLSPAASFAVCGLFLFWLGVRR